MAAAATTPAAVNTAAGVMGDEQIKWLGKNLPGWLGGGLTESQVNAMAKVWEKHHGAVMVGDVAGMLATLPVAGEIAGLGAKAAVGSERQAERGVDELREEPSGDEGRKSGEIDRREIGHRDGASGP
jgi:hypothetical protein